MTTTISTQIDPNPDVPASRPRLRRRLTRVIAPLALGAAIGWFAGSGATNPGSPAVPRTEPRPTTVVSDVDGVGPPPDVLERWTADETAREERLNGATCRRVSKGQTPC